MTKKKVSSSNGKESKKPAKKPQKEENFSNAELDIIHKSFEMVKRLKDEVQNIKESKDAIKQNIKNIEDKVAKHENPKSSESIHHAILHSLKEEIAKDFAPLLKKFDINEAKSEIYKEISKIIEIEAQKLKSEIDSMQNKNKKDFTKKLSDLEVKVLQTLSENKKIRDELKKKGTHVNFSKEIEERIRDIVSRANEKYFTMLDANTLDVGELKKQSQLLEQRIDKVKSAVRSSFSKEGMDLASIESKVIKLEEDNKSIKSLLERYENDLYKKTKTEELAIEKKVKATLDDANKKLGELEKGNKAQEQFIVDKINEVIDYVKVVENKLKSLEKNDLSQIEKNVLGILGSKTSELENKIKEFLGETRKELWTDYKQFMKLKEEILPLYEEFKKDFNIFSQSKQKVAKELRADIEKELAQLNKQAQQNSELTKSTIRELDENIKDFEKKFQLQTKKQVEDFKAQLAKELMESSTDGIAEMKKAKISMLSDIGNHQKDTFDRIENKFHEINTKYTKKFEELDSLLKAVPEESKKLKETFGKEKEAQQNFLVEKFNSIIDELNLKNKEQISEVRAATTKDFHSIVESKVKELLGDFSKEKSLLEKEFATHKKEIEKLYAKSLKELDKKIASFKEDKSQINKFLEESKSELASEIVQNSEFLTKINLENKEQRLELAEAIDIKFISSKEQYEAIFNSHLKSFEGAVKIKEDEYLSKLKIIEDDKNEMIKELEEFKTEIGTLTKDFVTKLDEEFQKLKSLETNFNNEKDAFQIQIDEMYQGRKQALEIHALELTEKLSRQIIEQKDKFEENENTFRELFTEKISGLHESLTKQVDSLKKSFVDKNLKYVTDKLDSEMEVFKLYEERLQSKEEELTTKIDSLNDQHDTFVADLESAREHLSERVEERLITMEQHFNKRFLDYDTSFGTFKGVVIDEVEGFMRDISNSTNQRAQTVEGTITKLKFTQSEMEKSFAEFSTLKDTYSSELNELREKVADATAKIELFNEVSTYGLNDHVQYMSEYEKQLIGLIKNLKAKGISDDNIRAALINKGHPTFYVTMIITSFDKIYN